MERAIKQKIEQFSLDFKHNIQLWLKEKQIIDSEGTDQNP